MRIRDSVRAQGIAANELGEPIRGVDGRFPRRSHFVEMNPDTALGDLPGSLGSRQPTPYDRDFFHNRN
jgi:hypothetical protein